MARSRRYNADITHPATIRKLDEGRTIAVVGDVYHFLATGEETDGKYAMWEAIVPPGGGPPPHVHSREEAFFVQGEATVGLGDDVQAAQTGTWIHMPANLKHSINATSPVVMLLVLLK